MSKEKSKNSYTLLYLSIATLMVLSVYNLFKAEILVLSENKIVMNYQKIPFHLVENVNTNGESKK